MRLGKKRNEGALQRELREQQAVLERAARAARRGVSPVEQKRLLAEMEPAAARAKEIRSELEQRDRSLQSAARQQAAPRGPEWQTTSPTGAEPMGAAARRAGRAAS